MTVTKQEIRHPIIKTNHTDSTQYRHKGRLKTFQTALFYPFVIDLFDILNLFAHLFD